MSSDEDGDEDEERVGESEIRLVSQLRRDPGRDETWSDADAEDARRAQRDEITILTSIFDERARGEDAEAARDGTLYDDEDETTRTRRFRLELEIELAPSSSGEWVVETAREDACDDERTRIRARWMPRIFLEFILPEKYPTRDAPAFVLTCDWLSNSHLSALCARLDDMWDASRASGAIGEPIVYDWTEWLKNSAMEETLVNADGVLNLSKKASGWAGDGFELDPRGIATARDAREAEFSILRADAIGRRREFLASEDNVCGTCFADDLRGAEMRRVSASCGHRFCVDCVTRMARVHVREGTVNELVCPHPDCSSSMDPQTLREVLDDEEFAKFEAIALSKALDAMQDLVYCPRCEHPTIEDEDHCGRCPGCLYTFCGLCRSAWHARSEPCLSPAQRLAVLEGRARGDSQMSEEALRTFREEMADASAAAYVARNGRTCPDCRQGIEKTEGCNKMTCTCGCFMCWTCGAKLSGDGYSHYRNVNGEPGVSACQLFDLDAVQAWENEMAALQLGRRGGGERRRERAADVVRCVRCKAANARFDGNNHVRCWSCNTSFCAACRRVVGKTSEHYGPGKPCKQHA